MSSLGYIDNPLLLMGYLDHSLDHRFARGHELSRWTWIPECGPNMGAYNTLGDMNEIAANF